MPMAAHQPPPPWAAQQSPTPGGLDDCALAPYPKVSEFLDDLHPSPDAGGQDIEELKGIFCSQNVFRFGDLVG